MLLFKTRPVQHFFTFPFVRVVPFSVFINCFMSKLSYRVIKHNTDLVWCQALFLVLVCTTSKNCVSCFFFCCCCLFVFCFLFFLKHWWFWNLVSGLTKILNVFHCHPLLILHLLFFVCKYTSFFSLCWELTSVSLRSQESWFSLGTGVCV